MANYRVLLVDDEGIVTESLEYMIQHNFSEQCMTEIAKTGRAAIEIAERFCPDIIFMDIQMPGINGIQAMKEIRRSSPNALFIVLSAYDNFDYAKEAIDLGVMEYLTKPVSQKIVVATVKKAIVLIEEKRERRKSDLLIREKLETVIPIIEHGFLYSLIFQRYNQDTIEHYGKLLGIEAQYGFMMTLLFGERQEGRSMTNIIGTSVTSQLNYTKIREIIKESMGGIIGAVMSNEIPIFIPCSCEKMTYNQRISYIETGRIMVRKLSNVLQMVFRLGIGTVVRLNETSSSYEGAHKALLNTSSRVAHVDDLTLTCSYEESYPIDLEKELFEAIQEGNEEESRKKASAFFDWMVHAYGEKEPSVRLKVLEFVLFAEKQIYLSGGMTYHFVGREDYLTTIHSASNNSELANWFLSKITQACHKIAGRSKKHGNALVEEAQRYIEENYEKEISLDEISRQLNISSYYFSKLFKETTKQNFVEYTTMVRLKRAKILLKDKRLGIKEIGIRIGYRDPNYFSRIFKKYEGVTPTEYREGV